MLNRLKNNRQILIFLLIFTLANGLLAWRLLPQPQPPPASPPAKIVWLLPDLLPAETPQAVYEKLQKRPLWTASKVTGIKSPSFSPPTAVTGKVVGILRQGKQHYLLWQDQTQKISRYPEGAVLPDQSQVIAINDHAVEIKKDEETRKIRLFIQKTEN